MNGLEDKNNHKLLTLSPKYIKENKNVNKYCEKLDDILSDKDLKNVALIGPYGSGKSSIIKTFLNDREEIQNNALIITIGSYINEKYKNDNILSSEEISLSNKVEESILKQIIFTQNENKFPKSTLIRFSKTPIIKEFFSIVSILLLIFIPLYFYIKIKNIPIFNILKKLEKIDLYLILVIFFIFLFLLYKLVHTLLNRVHIKKVNIKDCEIDLNNQSNNIFSRYLTEIIYYFQVTKKSLVIFEDLDRFPSDVTLNVIQELKELNTIVNNSHGIKKVTFLYNIKDDIFENTENKNKFFDYCLSILPLSTTFNSELNLVGLLKNREVYGDLSSNIIKIVSKYVFDMRTLINIVNDYCLFKDLTETSNYDKLFAMMAFKNQCFKEYNLLQTDYDIIKLCFNNAEFERNELIAEKKKKLNDDERFNDIENECLKNIDELKHLLLSYNIRNDYAVTDYYVNGEKHKISDFLDKEFDISTFDNEIEFNSYGYGTINDKNAFSKFGSKENFISRYKELLKTKEERIQKLLEENKKINKEIEIIRNDSVNNITKKYIDLIKLKENLKRSEEEQEKLKNNSKELTEEEKVNLNFIGELIAENFICEDYMDYVTSPVVFNSENGIESLTNSDSKFLMNVRQEKPSFDIPLTGFNTILERIKNDFKSPYILNYDLFNYLIDNNSKYLDEIFEQFSNFNEYNIKFLIEFLHKNESKEEKIMQILLNKKYDIWNGYKENESKLTEDDRLDIAKFILFNNKGLNLVSNKKSLKEFINEIPSYTMNDLLENNNFQKNICSLQVRLNDINYLDNENYDFVYNNNLYSFSENNIQRIVNTKITDIKKLKNKKDTNSLYNYIKEEIVNFCNEYYKYNDVILSEKRIIRSVFENENVSDDIKFLILSREDVTFDNIEKINPIFYDDIIKYNHFKINWKNILALYNQIENNKMLFDNLIEKIDAKLIENISDNLENENMKNFLNKFILYTLNSNLDLTEKLLIKYSPTYEIDNKYTSNQIKLLIKYNSIKTCKKCYKVIYELIDKNDRWPYIQKYYNDNKNKKSVFFKDIFIEDMENILKLKVLNNDENFDIIYNLYLKDKESENIKIRMHLSFDKGIEYKINYNKQFIRVLNLVNKDNFLKEYEKNIKDKNGKVILFILN